MSLTASVCVCVRHASDDDIRRAFVARARLVADGQPDADPVQLESLCMCFLLLSDPFMRGQIDAGEHELEEPPPREEREGCAAPWAAGVFRAAEKWCDDGNSAVLMERVQACLQASVAASGSREQVEAKAIELAVDHAESVERLYRKDDTAESITTKIEHRSRDRDFFIAAAARAHGLEQKQLLATAEDAETEIALLEKRLVALQAAQVPTNAEPQNQMETMREMTARLLAAQDAQAVTSLQAERSTMEALLASYDRPLAGSSGKAVNRAMLEEELANINRMLADIREDRGSPRPTPPEGVPPSRQIDCFWADASDKLEAAFTLPKEGVERGVAILKNFSKLLLAWKKLGANKAVAQWLATLQGSALRVGLKAVVAAAEAFLLLPKEKQTVSRLVTVIVGVVLKTAVKCVGFHYVQQWALNVVATSAGPKVCLAKLTAWATSGASATVGGAIVNQALPAAKVAGGKAVAGAKAAAVVKASAAGKGAVAASAFMAAHALPFAIAGAIVLSLCGLCAWGWRRRKKRSM